MTRSRPRRRPDALEPRVWNPKWTRWAIPLGVALITFVAFLPALHNGFVAWDDQSNFLENPYYRGLGWRNIRWMWTTFLLGHYVPLSWMTLGLDYVVWGMNPLGYHLTSMLLHSVVAVLMYFLARRLLTRMAPVRDPAGVEMQMAAAFAALLFAIHPLRVESVVWITERRDLLSGLFYLSTLLCYLRFLDEIEGRRKWYVLSIGAFLCALLSKGTAVTLPAVLLVLNVYPLRRVGTAWWSEGARRVYRELVPFVALAVGFVVLTFVALQSMPQLTVARKIAVSAYSLAFYLWKTVAPTGLAPLYDMPVDIAPLDSIYVSCYILVLGLTVGAWAVRKRRPGITTAWVLFVLILFPLLGVHQNGPQIAADRYTYNAAPVLAILAAAGWLSIRRPLAALPVSVVSGTVLVLAVLTWNQTGIWHDSVRMWSTVLKLNDRSSIALTALGNLEAQAGKPDSAIRYYRRSLEIDPTSPEAENNLGIALSRVGNSLEALEHFKRAIRLKAGYYEAENNLGLAIAQTDGNLLEAIEHYRVALRIKPDYADAHVNWGNALVQLGDFASAVPHYQQALAIRPDNADAHRNWGAALAQQGKLTEAIVHFRRALQIRPDFPEAATMLERAMVMAQGRASPPSGR